MIADVIVKMVMTIHLLYKLVEIQFLEMMQDGPFTYRT